MPPSRYAAYSTVSCNLLRSCDTQPEHVHLQGVGPQAGFGDFALPRNWPELVLTIVVLLFRAASRSALARFSGVTLIVLVLPLMTAPLPPMNRV